MLGFVISRSGFLSLESSHNLVFCWVTLSLHDLPQCSYPASRDGAVEKGKDHDHLCEDAEGGAS